MNRGTTRRRLRHVVLLWLLLAAASVRGADVFVSTSFHEPATDGLRFIWSRDGVRWDSVAGVFLRPEVGAQRVMRDPSIVRGPDGVFHLVWTSSWRGDRGFGYSCSRDLIHWAPQRFIPTGMDTTTVNTWAPELFYDDDEQLFYVVWASCVPGRFPDKLEAHDNNQRLYFMTTKDFRTFSEAQLYYDSDFSAIDATLVKRGRRDYVMVVKDNTRPMRNIRVAFGASARGPWSEASAPFTEQFTEGPSTARVGDWWYIYYDSYRLGVYGAHRTQDFKTFEDVTDKVRFPVGHKHGTVFRADERLVEHLLRYHRDRVHYSGTTVATPERHDGGLPPVVGVHNIQTMRGARPWTYNHQPMMAYHGGRFFVHYLTDPRHEHEAPGKTMMQMSDDGYTWSAPRELFPEYSVPEGYRKEGSDLPAAHQLKAVMHQRVGWYVAPNGKLLAIGYYGICLTMKDDPNDGNGIGRVVREVKADGTLGPVYFIHYNHGFSADNTDFPYYKTAKDKAFVKACEALLADPMQRMQWVEESDVNDPLLPLPNRQKAFCGYTLPNGWKVGLWKHAVTSISADGGATWRTPLCRAPGMVNSNAKIWGQRLSDGLYATVYNPAEYRWPLALSLSTDGLDYTTLSLVHGDVTPLRHGGQYKSYGPQYVRGIQEGNGVPKDSDLWVTYSNNKEDIWVSRIAVPVHLQATSHARGGFGLYRSLADMTDWNLYMPQWCPLRLAGDELMLADKDPYDYARAERPVPPTALLEATFDVTHHQKGDGSLQVEFLDAGGRMASRMVMDGATMRMTVKGGARSGTLVKEYELGRTYRIRVVLSAERHRSVWYVDGRKACERQFDTPVESISRLVFRTGPLFDEPNIETPADQDYDQPAADDSTRLTMFGIRNVETRAAEHFPGNDSDFDDLGEATPAPCAVLSTAALSDYADRFDADERAVYAADTEPRQAAEPEIANDDAARWMAANVPLFDCPDKRFQEIYYFRWWSLRKHLKRTPNGWGMTEFLVPRSYADRYNLIACALGHHVLETRWLRDTTYLHGILDTWYHGNDGAPMAKLGNFSSWTAAAVGDAWRVNGDTAFVNRLLPALEAEYARWEQSHRLSDGLYWQGDVQDGMEESISGGRRKRYARPTINSYMYGNARALASFCRMAGRTDDARRYEEKADTIKHLVEQKLWNKEHRFFETRRGDTLAQVREAIGYLPWYVRMIDTDKYDEAWQQLSDERGFMAPYGLTTAERRHPQFRTHGSGRCEWDGAIWPFATAQTLTALANRLEDSSYSNARARGPQASVFFTQMMRYADAQHHRGRPYIGEYLDEQNGAWLMGDRERSRYYNHSTFADLVITGLVGLRPQQDGSIVLNPLVPADAWDYFCLDGVNYRGRTLTIVWDRTGNHYHQGRGLTLLVDGVAKAHRNELGKLQCP